MATEWEGKSKGTLLGYKIFIFFLKNFGLGPAYFLLRFVTLYYFLFSLKSSRSIYYYFHKRLKQSTFKSIINIYRNYYTLGQVLTDKVAITTGFRNKFTYTHDGIEHINDLLEKNQGGILISGHIGNFEIAQYFFENNSTASKISMVTTHGEHENIKEYLDEITDASTMQFIIIKEDMSHIFEIHVALDKGGLVVFTGDRYLSGNKYLTETFLGAEAKFPLGPYLLASRLKIPVLYVYVMKSPNRHYSLYARKLTVKARDAQGLLKKYVESMEAMLEKYPLQWFNYYDFWEDNTRK